MASPVAAVPFSNALDSEPDVVYVPPSSAPSEEFLALQKQQQEWAQFQHYQAMQQHATMNATQQQQQYAQFLQFQEWQRQQQQTMAVAPPPTIKAPSSAPVTQPVPCTTATAAVTSAAPTTPTTTSTTPEYPSAHTSDNSASTSHNNGCHPIAWLGAIQTTVYMVQTHASQIRRIVKQVKGVMDGCRG